MVKFNRKLVRPLLAAIFIGLTASNLTAGVTFIMVKQKLARFMPAILLSLFSGNLVAAASANLAKIKEKLHLTKHVQDNNSNTNESAEEVEKKRVKEVISLVSGFANRSKQRADAFFSTGNGESYSTHVGKFAADLRDLEEQLIQPIKRMAENAPAGSTYKDIIERIHTIITKLYNNLNALQSTLNNGCTLRGPAQFKAVKLGVWLKSLKDNIGPTIDQLNAEINKLHEVSRKYDSEIAKNVESLKQEFNHALNNDPDRDAILKAIIHRFNCGS